MPLTRTPESEFVARLGFRVLEGPGGDYYYGVGTSNAQPFVKRGGHVCRHNTDPGQMAGYKVSRQKQAERRRMGWVREHDERERD